MIYFLLLPVQISETNFDDEHGPFFQTLKKIKAKAALVRIGSIPVVELSKLKDYMLNTDTEG